MLKKIRFTIKKPKGARRSFAVVKDNISPDGSRKQKTIKDPDIDSINARLLAGQLAASAAYVHIKQEIIPKLKKASKIPDKAAFDSQVSAENLKIFAELWDKEYERSTIRPSSLAAAKVELIAALRKIEPLSLISSPESALQAKLNTLSGQQNRKYGWRINQLLRASGRGFELNIRPKIIKPVKFITIDALNTILNKLDDKPAQLLAQVLFGTGCRIGEAFMLTAAMLRPNNGIYIQFQMLRDGIPGAPLKNSKPHTTVLLPEFKAAYKEWCEVPNRAKLRNRLEEKIRQAAKAAGKPITPHDLRHSFAIHMLGKGLTLSDIGTMLGDEEQTVRDYYAGYVMEDSQIDRINSLLEKKK